MTVYTNEQIANYLVEGEDGKPRKWETGGTITVNYSAVESGVRALVQSALDTWSDVSGLQFVWEGNASNANIQFDDNRSGAYASYSFYNFPSQFVMADADVNISTAWIDAYGTDTASYSFQTYLHEIGHALGLGHAGDYDGNATYGVDNHYDNDSWQATVMSYFTQSENTSVNASFAFVITPMIADVLAMWELYGKPNNLRTTDTVYGVGSTAGGVYDEIASIGSEVTFNIVDDGGWDIIDFSNDTRDQTVRLRPEHYSDVYGLVGNMTIMRDTIIEQYNAGQGNDIIVGNEAENLLNGNGGNDVIYSVSNGSNNNTINGGNGHDTIHLANGSGSDTVNGNSGNDTAVVRGNNGSFSGGSGTDTVRFMSGLNNYLYEITDGVREFFNVITRYTFSVMSDVERFQFSGGARQFSASELSGATQIISIETTGTALQHAAQGIYLLGGVSSDIAVTSNGEVIGATSLSGWNAIQTEADSSGYRLLWQNQDGRYSEWFLNGQGQKTGGALITNVIDVEQFYGTDINNDGTIGHGTATIENDGTTSLISTTQGRYLINGSIEITNRGDTIGPNSVSGWNIIHAEADGDGYRVLWQHQSGRYSEWALDSQGAKIRGASVNYVEDVEAFYGADINNDDTIGHTTTTIEDDGSTTLTSSSSGIYLIDSSIRISVHGDVIGANSLPGWRAIQVEEDGDGYRALWQHQDGRFAEWMLGAQGEKTGGTLVNHIADIEAFYGADINNDGTIGHTTTTIEDDGTNTLASSTRGVYLIDGSTEITVRGSAMGPNSLAGWSLIQAEADGGGYRVLWQDQNGRYAEWMLNSQGEKTGGALIPDVADVEAFYDADINRDAIIGHGSSMIEDNGSTTLAASSRGVYLINDSVEVTVRGDAMGPESLVGWSLIQAEADEGGYRVLWENSDGRYAEWMLNSQGEKVGGALITDVGDIEGFYGADIDGNDQIGHISGNEPISSASNQSQRTNSELSAVLGFYTDDFDFISQNAEIDELEVPEFDVPINTMNEHMNQQNCMSDEMNQPEVGICIAPMLEEDLFML